MVSDWQLVGVNRKPRMFPLVGAKFRRCHPQERSARRKRVASESWTEPALLIGLAFSLLRLHRIEWKLDSSW